MRYEDMIRKIAGEIVEEAIAEPEVVKTEPKLDIVQKTAASIIAELEKTAAEEEEKKLSEQAVEALGLKGKEKEKDDEEDDEEDKEKESEEEAEEAVKTAKQYLAAALSIEKEAQAALAEADLMKAASLQVLYNFGAIEASDMEKIASMTYDELFE